MLPWRCRRSHAEVLIFGEEGRGQRHWGWVTVPVFVGGWGVETVTGVAPSLQFTLSLFSSAHSVFFHNSITAGPIGLSTVLFFKSEHFNVTLL